MGHDEDKNSFDAGAAKPITSQPRTNITGNNRLGMRSGRNISAAQAELDRISADSNPNAVPSTATGDIVLNNPAPKGKKSPKIIILAVLVVLAVVAAVVSVVVTNGKGGGNEGGGSNDKADKTSYLKLLQYGNAEEEKSVDKNISFADSYIYRATIEETSTSDRSEYGKQLLDAYKKYSTEENSVRKLLNSYYAYMNLEKELTEIENTYLSNGEKAARERFASEKIEEQEEGNGIYKALTNADYLSLAVYEYKTAFVDELAAYSSAGCITNGSKDIQCIEIMRSNVEFYPDFLDTESILFSIDDDINDFAESVVKELYKESLAGE